MSQRLPKTTLRKRSCDIIGGLTADEIMTILNILIRDDLILQREYDAIKGKVLQGTPEAAAETLVNDILIKKPEKSIEAFFEIIKVTLRKGSLVEEQEAPQKGASHEISARKDIAATASDMNDTSLGQTAASATPVGTGSHKQVPENAATVATGQQERTIAEYKMDKSPHGICLIINNMTFHHVPGDPNSRPRLTYRVGSEKDVEKVRSTFEDLNFIVCEENDLNSADMLKKLEDYANMKENIAKNRLEGINSHANFDSFVCCIMTHGTLGYVFGSDSRQVPIYDLVKPFIARSCVSLIGKPKLFFIQACQGSTKQIGEWYTDGEEKEAQWLYAPDMGDFVISCSTVPGFVSRRNAEKGSVYFQKLCEVIKKHSDKWPLLDILTEVNRQVSSQTVTDEDGQKHVQTPEQRFTLEKKMYLRPAV